MYAGGASPSPETASHDFRRRTWYTRHATAVHITVRFFAAHREATGQPTLALELPEGTSAATAFERVCARFPALKQAAAGVAFAVNQAHTSGEHVLHAGDELAFLPPMSGG